MELSQEKNRSAADKSLTSALCIYTYCMLYYIMIGFFVVALKGQDFVFNFERSHTSIPPPPPYHFFGYILYLCICVSVRVMCVCVRVCLYCSIMKRKINTHRRKMFIMILICSLVKCIITNVVPTISMHNNIMQVIAQMLILSSKH